SNADKRRAVLILLEDDEWSTWADREIARRCAVDNKTVARLREELTPHTEEILSEAAPRTYEDRHGNVTQMRTAAIGRKPAEPPPVGEPESAETAAAPEASPEPTNIIPLAPHLTELPTP
ncbi:hypothetical protein MKK68_01040, partial [Methylobacterium sp. E-016]|uniref:hypothetical protein n=1 Tax=Methylobacterium sp. E-016 TaxID=2836556 RepID=UPI001FBAEDE5